jgi:hypothetical protein
MTKKSKKLPDGRARRSLGEAGANHFRFTEIVSSEKSDVNENISLYQK